MTDRAPSPSQGPITAELNGSSINIYDVEGIVRDATANSTAIYDRSDFSFPLERVRAAAEIVRPEGEDALALESVLQLDRTQAWDSTWLISRFRAYFGPQDLRLSHRKKPPFNVKAVTFANTYLFADEENGSRFILWVQQNTGRLMLTNELVLESNGKKLEIHPPAIYSCSVEDQVKSLMKATAMVADFANGFDATGKVRSTPLNREYVVGKEHRPLKRSSLEGRLGAAAVKHTQGSSNQGQTQENTAWAEEHGIESFKADEKLTLDDIGGLSRVKKMLRNVAISFKHPEAMEKWGASRPQGVIMYGEPGTGKTMLAQALANEIGAETWPIQSTDIYEKWLGKSEEKIKEIFARARQAKEPLILFFDEFESIVGITDEPSPGGADNARNGVAGIFKQEMNTLAKENPNILVVAATNDIDKINPSLLRSGRFDYKIYVPMPDEAARKEIVANLIAKTMLGKERDGFKIFADDLNAAEVATRADGLSGADLTEVFRRLCMSHAMEEARTGQEQPPITQAEALQELQNFNQGL